MCRSLGGLVVGLMFLKERVFSINSNERKRILDPSQSTGNAVILITSITHSSIYNPIFPQDCTAGLDSELLQGEVKLFSLNPRPADHNPLDPNDMS